MSQENQPDHIFPKDSNLQQFSQTLSQRTTKKLLGLHEQSWWSKVVN
jgi:hypothetical protein